MWAFILLCWEIMYEAVANSAEIVAGVLGIAVTVVAIIVELAATRFNHRITNLFIRDPVNLLVLSFFVLTTLLCVWVAAMSSGSGSSWIHNLTMVMISVALLILLPYFGYVFSFISPINVINRISSTAVRQIDGCNSRNWSSQRMQVAQAIDEIQDVLRSAIDTSDRDIAIHCVNSLMDVLVEYQKRRERLPQDWFVMNSGAAEDPDFVSLEASALARIEETRTWFEYKIFSQYYTALGLCIPRLRDVANLISIRTRQLATTEPALSASMLELCLVSFNSYLRTTINARDPRTAYYILSQYRLVAEALVERGDVESVSIIARRMQFYGLLGFRSGQPFILEVCAYDLVQLLERCLPVLEPSVDSVLSALLEMDQEARSEAQEVSLAGVRRAQIRAATAFLEAGDDLRANRVIEDLSRETHLRWQKLVNELENEHESEYWELTPRGINFSFLPQERRKHLETIRQRLSAK